MTKIEGQQTFIIDVWTPCSRLETKADAAMQTDALPKSRTPLRFRRNGEP